MTPERAEMVAAITSLLGFTEPLDALSHLKHWREGRTLVSDEAPDWDDVATSDLKTALRTLRDEAQAAQG